MTALTAARNTKERAGDVFGFPVKASVICYLGGLAVLNAGYAAPGSTATGLVAVGRFEEDADNSAGGDGAIEVRVKRGVFKFANSGGGDLIAQADVGADCYIVDDQTVAKTDGTWEIAGLPENLVNVKLLVLAFDDTETYNVEAADLVVPVV